MLTGKLTPEQFLKRYWQRKPVLLKNAFADFADLISPEELAGLACEPDVESRIIFTDRIKQQWRLQNGPFSEDNFLSLPEREWTLLVQAADQWLPEVRSLLQSVDFLPSWRVDDVMVSYATAGGGVGPHFDQYDVFLVQGMGSRRWRTGQHCKPEDASRDESGLKLLHDFHTEAEYELQCGDVLYVPPGVAHWGISNDNSLSYSIGFRAPSLQELLLGFTDYLSDQCSEDQRYTDPRLPAEPRRGEIPAEAISKAHKLLMNALQDKAAFARWFAAAMTEPRYPELLQPRTRIPAACQRAIHFKMHAAARIAWQEMTNKLLITCNGQTSEHADSKALRTLLQAITLPEASISAALFERNAACRALKQELLLNGSLNPEPA